LHSSPRAATYSRGKIRFSKQPPLLLLRQAVFFISLQTSILKFSTAQTSILEFSVGVYI